MAKQYDTSTQLKVLALIARGDTHRQISEATSIPIPSIADIKKRNKTALTTIENRMVEHQASKSKKLLDKAHDLIERKLDKVASADNMREELLQSLRDKDIDIAEYHARLAIIEDASIKDLTGVSREMFQQSQIESGKPTSISDKPGEAQDQLMSLVEAIKGGDEVQLFKMVLNPQTDEIPSQTIEGEVVV